jgi:hypothetical protein
LPILEQISSTFKMSESLKRKRGAQDFVPVSNGASNSKPTRICSTGKDAKAAIESGSKDGELGAIISLDFAIYSCARI